MLYINISFLSVDREDVKVPAPHIPKNSKVSNDSVLN
jgi:hypothetical protein